MSRYRQLLTISAVILCALARPAAQQLSGLTTIDRDTASREFFQALDREVRLRPVGCNSGELTTQLQSPGPWVVITTANCLSALSLEHTKLFGPAVGPAAFVYTLDTPKHGVRFEALDETLQIGILSSEGGMRDVLTEALVALGMRVTVHLSEGYRGLVADLVRGVTHGVVVFDDGTGTALDELFQTASKIPGRVAQLRRVPLERRTNAWILNLGLEQALASVVDTNDGVFAIDLSMPTESGAQAVPFLRFTNPTLSISPPSRPVALTERRPWWRNISPVVLLEALTSVPAPPDPPTLPLVVARALPTARLNALTAAVSRASLVIPIEAAVNPCHPKTTKSYRALVRAAAGSAAHEPGLVTPLWEHAAMRAAINKNLDALPIHAEAARLSALKGVQNRGDLMTELKTLGGDGKCDLSDRPIFSRSKLAFYQRAMSELQLSLDSQKLQGDRKRHFDEAVACMVVAVAKDATPSCADPTSAMWTDHYAPFLAASVMLQKADGFR